MFWVTFDLSSANAFNLDKPKILSSGKGLNKSLKKHLHQNTDNYMQCFYQEKVFVIFLISK